MVDRRNVGKACAEGHLRKASRAAGISDMAFGSEGRRPSLRTRAIQPQDWCENEEPIKWQIDAERGQLERLLRGAGGSMTCGESQRPGVHPHGSSQALREIGTVGNEERARKVQGGISMEAPTAFSRRQMLAMSASAGCLAVESTLRSASAQVAKRIEQYAPELEQVVSTTEPVQELASGSGGALGPTEGPVWLKEGGYLLYSDIHNSRRMKYTPGQGTSVFVEPTDRANGLTRDLQGRLLACEHDSRRVTRKEADRSITVLANSFQGRRLNRPNDVVVKSDGSIYFTDPWSSPLPREQWDLTFSGVYRLSPRSWNPDVAARRYGFPQRARLLAGRKRTVHQRFPSRPYPRLRYGAERDACEADRPRQACTIDQGCLERRRPPALLFPRLRSGNR
jgi:hypothetical protein